MYLNMETELLLISVYDKTCERDTNEMLVSQHIVDPVKTFPTLDVDGLYVSS